MHHIPRSVNFTRSVRPQRRDAANTRQNRNVTLLFSCIETPSRPTATRHHTSVRTPEPPPANPTSHSNPIALYSFAAVLFNSVLSPRAGAALFLLFPDDDQRGILLGTRDKTLFVTQNKNNPQSERVKHPRPRQFGRVSTPDGI